MKDALLGDEPLAQLSPEWASATQVFATEARRTGGVSFVEVRWRDEYEEGVSIVPANQFLHSRRHRSVALVDQFLSSRV